jgi:hypothetical protein
MIAAMAETITLEGETAAGLRGAARRAASKF